MCTNSTRQVKSHSFGIRDIPDSTTQVVQSYCQLKLISQKQLCFLKDFLYILFRMTFSMSYDLHAIDSLSFQMFKSWSRVTYLSYLCHHVYLDTSPHTQYIPGTNAYFYLYCFINVGFDDPISHTRDQLIILSDLRVSPHVLKPREFYFLYVILSFWMMYVVYGLRPNQSF